mmetsp:Transcript_4559/g.6933  ORF Transcript_4559/g.6933 Transcript_4559/m.6933 type:complete len:82 (+) Transcript_4559:705-950(+)
MNSIYTSPLILRMENLLFLLVVHQLMTITSATVAIRNSNSTNVFGTFVPNAGERFVTSMERLHTITWCLARYRATVFATLV